MIPHRGRGDSDKNQHLWRGTGLDQRHHLLLHHRPAGLRTRHTITDLRDDVSVFVNIVMNGKVSGCPTCFGIMAVPKTALSTSVEVITLWDKAVIDRLGLSGIAQRALARASRGVLQVSSDLWRSDTSQRLDRRGEQPQTHREDGFRCHRER